VRLASRYPAAYDRGPCTPCHPSRRRQGWAPRLRDGAAMRERGGRSQEMGVALRAQARQLGHEWPRVRAGTLSHAQVRGLMRPLQRTVARWLQDALWTRGRVAGVAPTNHAASAPCARVSCYV
jgi:hypothetical protein